MVVRVRADYVLSEEAYVLFYAKRGTPWFSDFIEEQRPFIDPSMRSTSPKSVLENTDICVPSPLLPNSQAFGGKESNTAANESSPNSLDKVQGSEGKKDVQMMSTPTPPLGSSNILDSKSREVDKVSSPSVLIHVSKPVSRVSVLQENCSIPDHGLTSKTLYITPETPPRSPSPEIYREDPPDNDYHIPRDRQLRFGCTTGSDADYYCFFNISLQPKNLQLSSSVLLSKYTCNSISCT